MTKRRHKELLIGDGGGRPALCVNGRPDDDFIGACIEHVPIEMEMYSIRYFYLCKGELYFVLNELNNPLCGCAAKRLGLDIEPGFYAWRFRDGDFAEMAKLRETAANPPLEPAKMAPKTVKPKRKAPENV